MSWSPWDEAIPGCEARLLERISPMRRNARALRPLSCLLALILAGCGASTGTVTGKVTLKGGKPVTGGTVTFIGTDQKVVTSPIDAEGTYTIPKVPVGEVKIGVAPPPTLPQTAGMMD